MELQAQSSQSARRTLLCNSLDKPPSAGEPAPEPRSGRLDSKAALQHATILRSGGSLLTLTPIAYSGKSVRRILRSHIAGSFRAAAIMLSGFGTRCLWWTCSRSCLASRKQFAEFFQNYWDFQQRWNAVKPTFMHGMIANFMAPYDAPGSATAKSGKHFRHTLRRRCLPGVWSGSTCATETRNFSAPACSSGELP